MKTNIITITSNGNKFVINSKGYLSLDRTRSRESDGSVLSGSRSTDIINGLVNGVMDDIYWISADYHLFKEKRKTGSEREQALKDTKEVIKLHNSIVKPDDPFIFLGDLSESEYADSSYEVLKVIKETTNRLNGKKTLIIIGNNDTCGNQFYKDCGFKFISRAYMISNDKLILSHYPVNTSGDQVNIHGHIHGSKKYWGLDPKNKIDCYWKLWNGPVKYSTLMKELKSGKYKGVRVNGDSNNPETSDSHL